MYNITYTAWDSTDGEWPATVLTGLDRKGVADVLRYLADFNFRHGWAVWDATITTTQGEYVGNPSFRSFAREAEMFLTPAGL